MTGPTGVGTPGVTGPVGTQLPFTGSTGTTLTVGVTTTSGWPLAGFGTGGAGAWTYTPVLSQRAEVHVQTCIRNNSAQSINHRIMYGTGTAPSRGGTGGTPVPYGQGMVSSAIAYRTLHLTGIVSNLVIGTPYWFDVASLSGSVSVQTYGNTGPGIGTAWTIQEI